MIKIESSSKHQIKKGRSIRMAGIALGDTSFLSNKCSTDKFVIEKY